MNEMTLNDSEMSLRWNNEAGQYRINKSYEIAWRWIQTKEE